MDDPAIAGQDSGALPSPNAEGLFLVRTDPATGSTHRLTLEPWSQPIDGESEPPEDPGVSPEDPDSSAMEAHRPRWGCRALVALPRTVVCHDGWVVVSHPEPPVHPGEVWRDRFTCFALRGPVREPVFPEEGIELVRAGKWVAPKVQTPTEAGRVEVANPRHGDGWSRVGTERLVVGEYRVEFDGDSGGGLVFAAVVGDRLEVTVTGEGGNARIDGQMVPTRQETVWSYPLASIRSGTLGSGFGRVKVRLRPGRGSPG